MVNAPLGKSLVVTAVAVAAAVGISYSIRLLIGQPFSLTNLALSILTPAAVALPIAYWMFRQAAVLAEAHRELAVRARQDGMTKLLNREAFLSALNDACAQERRFALLLIDVDNFKSINDGFGHAEGDRALIIIAQALKSNCRKQDAVGRVGGEEFAALLDGVDNEADGRTLAEVMRKAIEAIPWMTINGKKRRLTVSVGGVVARKGESADALLREADDYLYRAKRQGRNCTAFRDDFPDLPHQSGPESAQHRSLI